jgi:hypothetical protein
MSFFVFEIIGFKVLKRGAPLSEYLRYMHNQENAHSDATEKSLKSLFQKINQF